MSAWLLHTTKCIETLWKNQTHRREARTHPKKRKKKTNRTGLTTRPFPIDLTSRAFPCQSALTLKNRLLERQDKEPGPPYRQRDPSSLKVVQSIESVRIPFRGKASSSALLHFGFSNQLYYFPAAAYKEGAPWRQLPRANSPPGNTTSVIPSFLLLDSPLPTS
ncbi:Inositol-pentakisphosphate 2-kinase [Musa troglodytarum]|uniref:Inositol-pentakisphosphate 2-kinase n=1 Tax=Musa troglodytarum TaxID=320322 RepID=A0A9E7H7H4_9LILI|nr:Inositol-pentakisphosphate 2-kinase [Musa troglodytarum]